MQTVDLAQFVPPKKRRKVDTDEETSRFLPGSIMRIKLKNFMSYTLSEFQMAPNLNMIIGPNGTGKSTIVCAICIGLAGKTDYLGKPTMQITQFVKQGEINATIEIELKGKRESERVVVRRDISTTTAKSKWYVNKRESNEKQVRELVRSLDIQLDNLCQFLAQDRVSKFAAQKPNELLKEIERSFSGGELLEQHENLIRLAEEQQKSEKERIDLETRLSVLMREKDSLASEVEKFKKYQERKEDYRMHKKLIPFVKIQDAKAHFNKMKAERDAKYKEFKAFEARSRPISVLIDSYSDSANNLSEEIATLVQQESYLREKIESKSSLCKHHDEEVVNLGEQLRRKLTEIVKKSRKLEAMEQDAEEWQKKKLSYEQDSVSEDDLKRKTSKRNELSEKLNEIRHETESIKERVRLLKERELKFDGVISNLNSQLHTNDKLNVLSGFDDFSPYAKTLKAIQFLRQNGEKFADKAFEPPVISLTVQKGYGVILSNIVSLDSQLAITTTSQTNHKYVTQAIMDHLKLNTSFRQISSNFTLNESERHTPTELKMLGFEGYLVDFINGPAPVVQMLCEQHMIHLIPVCTKTLTAEQLENVQRSPKIQTFVSGDQIFRTFTSQYGNKRPYSTATFLNPTYRLFDTKGLSEDAKRSIEAKIGDEKAKQDSIVSEIEAEKSDYGTRQKEFEEFKHEYRELDNSIKRAHESRNRLSKAISKCDQLTKDMKAIRDEIESLKTENRSDVKRKSNQLIAQTLAKKLAVIKEIVTLYGKLDKVREEIIFKQFDKLQQDNKKLSIKEIAKDVENRRDQLRQECEDLKMHCKELKHQTSEQIKELNTAISRELSSEERGVLTALAKTYMEAEEFEESKILLKIEKIRQELNSFSDAEESSITKFSRVEGSINDIELRLPELRQHCEMHNKQINDIKSSWLPRLQSLIASISKNFNENFCKIYPAGEVRLHQDPNSYNDWRLEIAVQFKRDGDLAVLDGTTQSGGEKSVSTAIFLNSLQGLMDSPFRVVDEINQGMDARNERLVHKLIVESACQQSSSSQYFLITPKLLTDLVYHEKMSVHCIMAGKFCPDPLADEEFLSFGIAANYV